VSSRARGDDGAAAVLVLAIAALVALLAATTAAVAAVGVARQRAAAVADLAALAAARHALEGPAVACGWALRLAAADGAELVGCQVRGDVVEVVAQVRPPGRLGVLGAVTGRARAGPADPPRPGTR
jgi:secretion/DNA translocation related TadE-like protein